MKKKRIIYFWWSSSVMGVEFVKFIRMRNGTGREDTNKIGVGTLVKSELYTPYDGKEREFKISPYTPIYRTYKSAYNHKNEIKKPTPEEVKQYDKLVKKLDI